MSKIFNLLDFDGNIDMIELFSTDNITIKFYKNQI